MEDEADLALIVADTLKNQGYEVTTAADGAEGLERFKNAGADIIIADVMMPRMDGFSMARAVRKLSPTVPLLFLTAKSTIDDLEEGFESGANDYLKKPFELRELIIRIKALLRRSDIDRPTIYASESAHTCSMYRPRLLGSERAKSNYLISKQRYWSVLPPILARQLMPRN